MARLQEKLTPHQQVTREILTDAIAYAFNPPKEFEEYRKHWGALQAQGMFLRMTQENKKVSELVRAKMTEDLQRVYSQNLQSAQS